MDLAFVLLVLAVIVALFGDGSGPGGGLRDFGQLFQTT